MLLELINKNADALRTMGEQAIAEANEAGVAAYFMDPARGEGILRQLPDGTLQRVRIVIGGDDLVLETLPSRNQWPR